MENDPQITIQNFLRDRFFDLQIKNPQYSLRAFSQKVGLSPSAVSELIRGRRRISQKIAERIAERLLLDPHETELLLKDFRGKTRTPTNEITPGQRVDKPDHLKLTADQFHLISDWKHFAILSLLETKKHESSPQWIANRLGSTASKVSACLTRLARLKLIAQTPAGIWKRTATRLHTSDEIESASLQKAHIADMEIAKRALLDLPLELRDFTSISCPADPSVMPKVKAAIRRFREEMTEILRESPATEVYQMSVYVYPLTQIKSPKSQKRNLV